MANYLITFLLFIIPFIIFPFGNSQFEMPKIVMAILSIELLIVIVLLKKKFNFLKRLNKVQSVLIGLIFFITLYQLIFLRTSFTFLGDPTRLQGIFLLWHLLIFSLFASFVRYKPLTWFWYTLMLIIIFAVSLFIGNQNGRAVATLGDPNSLAAFVIFLWPFLFFSNFKKTFYKKMTIYVSIFLTLGILFLAGSKSGVLAFGIELLLFFLVFILKISLKTAVIISFCIILVSYTFPYLIGTLYENRGDIWNSSIKAGIQDPIFGSGFGNMEIVLNKTNREQHNSLIGYSIDSTHNIFLDWWVQGGIIALISITLLVFFTIKNFCVKKRVFELLLFLGILTIMSFNPVSVVCLVDFWWLVGVSFSKEIYR